jgi:outer membrane protein OmpA-like peptidoglycan-associated protein
LLSGRRDIAALKVGIGQAEGFARDDLERGNPETREAVISRMEGLDPTLTLVDLVDAEGARMTPMAGRVGLLGFFVMSAVGCGSSVEPATPPPMEARAAASPAPLAPPAPPGSAAGAPAPKPNTSAPAPGGPSDPAAPAGSSAGGSDSAVPADDFDKVVDPPPGALAWISGGMIRTTNPVVFDIGKATIKPESFPTLDAVVDILLKHPKLRVEIGGHIDQHNGPPYGSDLSKKRAQSVRHYLVHKGVEADRLQAVGYGATKPIAPPSPGKPSPNRRIEIVIIRR